MVSTRAQVRRLRPMNEPLSRFIDQLNDEVLLYIFDILNATQRSDVVTASCVCARWHSLAQRVIDNHIGPLSINNKDRNINATLFRRLRSDRALQSRVNHIHIGDWNITSMDFQRTDQWVTRYANPYVRQGYFSEKGEELSRQQDQTWSQIKPLACAVQRLKLASFTWSAMPSLPEPLAEALSTQTSCKVNIRMHEGSIDYAPIMYTPYLNPRGLHSIAPIQSMLAKLELLVPAGDARLLRQVGSYIRGAKNLQSLTIYAVGRVWSEIHVPDAHIGTALDAFTTVKNMSWLCPSQGHEDARAVPLKSIGLTNFCACKASSANQSWTDSISWDHLRWLSLSCTTVLRQIVEKRPNLTGLALILSNDRECEYSMCPTRLTSVELGDILERQQSLQDLTLVNGTELVTPSLIRCLPQKLRRLSTHEITSPLHCNMPSMRPVLGARTLHLLAQRLPTLSDLALDVPFADVEYLAYLRFTLSIFPNLHTLTAYREAEWKNADLDTPPRGPVKYSTVLRDFQTYLSPPLQTFVVCVSSVSPFDRDRWYNERGGNNFVFGTVNPRTFVVERGCSVRCKEVEIAKRLMKGGNEFFEREYVMRQDLAENCWRYQAEPEGYFQELLCTGGVT